MKTLFVILGVCVLVGLLVALGAFWLSCLWGWFVVGLVPWAAPITTWQAFGLQLVVASAISLGTASSAIHAKTGKGK